MGAHEFGTRLSDFNHQNLTNSKIHIAIKNKRNTHSGAVKNIEIKLEGEEKSESGNITNRSGASVTLYQKMQDNLIQQRKNVSLSKALQQTPLVHNTQQQPSEGNNSNNNTANNNKINTNSNAATASLNSKKSGNIFNLSKSALNKFRYPQNVTEKNPTSPTLKASHPVVSNTSKQLFNEQKHTNNEPKHVEPNIPEQHNHRSEKTKQTPGNTCTSTSLLSKNGKSIDLNFEKVKDSTNSSGNLKRVSYDSFSNSNLSNSLNLKFGLEKK